MFWQKPEGLGRLPLSSKLGLTAFLSIAGIGYLLGFANIYLAYSPVDQKPGMSIADVRMAFSGTPGSSTFESSIDGSMRTYFASDEEYQALKDWLAGGATERGFATVEPVLASSCTTCHSADGGTAGVSTASYADVKPLLASDTGKSVPRLVALSHTHVLGTLPVIFLLCLVFSVTLHREGLKVVVILASFLAIVVDIGSWWLAKFVAALAPLVIVGGVCLAFSFLVLILLSLQDLWLRRKA
jgi:hypothetical protein